MKITGYADKISARPGETLQFMVNCERPRYRADIVRLVCGDLNPEGPGIREHVVPTPANKSYKGRSQKIESGSYVLISNSPPLQNIKSFTVQACCGRLRRTRAARPLCRSGRTGGVRALRW